MRKFIFMIVCILLLILIASTSIALVVFEIKLPNYTKVVWGAIYGYLGMILYRRLTRS